MKLIVHLTVALFLIAITTAIGNLLKLDRTDIHSFSQDNSNMSGNDMDQHFIMEATKGGKMEVEMAKKAKSKAQNTRVKNFADMMIRDHTKANKELENIVQNKKMKSWSQADSSASHNINDMNETQGKSGKDFDVTYMNMMVNDHNKTIELFENQSKNGNDADLKSFAGKTLPVLKMHLDSATAINASLKR
jgi:putative membrane protein